MFSAGAKILVISPIRNEGEYLQRTIDSMINQTVTPAEWVIVDDGSSDNTWELIYKLPEKYPWIKVVQKPDRGKRAVGPGVIETFYFGLNQASIKDYDFICKMDGDIEFQPCYFEHLLTYFDNDPYLGAASGKPYLDIDGKLIAERTHDEMVAGQINFYKRECFNAIDGFVREVHWDAIVFHRARMAGYRTRSIEDPKLVFLHLRLMGSSHKGIVHGRLRWGRGQYFLGTSPIYLLFIGLYRAFERPYLIGGVCIVLGYIKASISGMERYNFPGFRKSLHAWQFERLKVGKRLEKIPSIS